MNLRFFTRKVLPILILTLVLFLFGLSGITYAQTGGSYDLFWHTFDGGGAIIAKGGIFSLSGTIGQPEAGRQSGGIYLLNGGFWVEASHDLFLPLILK